RAPREDSRRLRTATGARGRRARGCRDRRVSDYGGGARVVRRSRVSGGRPAPFQRLALSRGTRRRRVTGESNGALRRSRVLRSSSVFLRMRRNRRRCPCFSAFMRLCRFTAIRLRLQNNNFAAPAFFSPLLSLEHIAAEQAAHKPPAHTWCTDSQKLH